MKKFKEMTGNEKKAVRAIRETYNYEVGGWLNAIWDGEPEEVPETMEEAKDYIYLIAFGENEKEIHFVYFY